MYRPLYDHSVRRFERIFRNTHLRVGYRNFIILRPCTLTPAPPPVHAHQLNSNYEIYFTISGEGYTEFWWYDTSAYKLQRKIRRVTLRRV